MKCTNNDYYFKAWIPTPRGFIDLDDMRRSERDKYGSVGQISKIIRQGKEGDSIFKKIWYFGTFYEMKVKFTGEDNSKCYRKGVVSISTKLNLMIITRVFSVLFGIIPIVISIGYILWWLLLLRYSSWSDNLIVSNAPFAILVMLFVIIGLLLYYNAKKSKEECDRSIIVDDKYEVKFYLRSNGIIDLCFSKDVIKEISKRIEESDNRINELNKEIREFSRCKLCNSIISDQVENLTKEDKEKIKLIKDKINTKEKDKKALEEHVQQIARHIYHKLCDVLDLHRNVFHERDNDNLLMPQPAQVKECFKSQDKFHSKCNNKNELCWHNKFLQPLYHDVEKSRLNGKKDQYTGAMGTLVYINVFKQIIEGVSGDSIADIDEKFIKTEQEILGYRAKYVEIKEQKEMLNIEKKENQLVRTGHIIMQISALVLSAGIILSLYGDINGGNNLSSGSVPEIVNIICNTTQYIEKLVSPRYNLVLSAMIFVVAVVLLAKFITESIDRLKRAYDYIKCFVRLMVTYFFSLVPSDGCIKCKNKYKETKKFLNRIRNDVFDNEKNNDDKKAVSRFVIRCCFPVVLLGLFLVTFLSLETVDITCGLSNTNTISVISDIMPDLSDKFNEFDARVEEWACASTNKSTAIDDIHQIQKDLLKKGQD